MKLSHRSSGLAQPLRTVAYPRVLLHATTTAREGTDSGEFFVMNSIVRNDVRKVTVSLSPMPLSKSNMTRFVDKNYKITRCANRKI